MKKDHCLIQVSSQCKVCVSGTVEESCRCVLMEIEVEWKNSGWTDRWFDGERCITRIRGR